MKFAIVRNGDDPLRDGFADEIAREFSRNGHEETAAENGAGFRLNLTSVERPRRILRRSESEICVALAVVPRTARDMRSICYTTLIRTFSNLMLCVAESDGEAGAPEIYFATPEVGFYHYPFEPRAVYESMLPIVGSRLAIRNRMSTDLPRAYWEGSPVVTEIRRHGHELDRLGLLPTPFPLADVLSEDDIRHLYRVFGITGLSYGNLSARERVHGLGESTFWMSARGVDKSRLGRVGKDVLLVKGFDDSRAEVLVSMPPDHDEKARVSVDAVEHELIYRSYPEVGAIVHVHAWMDGILATRQNYPCGTGELAREVVQLLARTPDPSRAVVGLKNHGLTITGHDLTDTFSRIRGRLRTEVPMYA